MTVSSLSLLPLQALTNFAIDDVPFSLTDFIIGVSILAVIIGAVVFLNISKKEQTSISGKPKNQNAGSMPGLLTGLKLNNMARSLGLNHEQRKMLDYIFKLDMVTDPEKSINTPVLLDRHFRRAYRDIESSGSEKEAQHRLSVLFEVRNVLENSVIGGFTSTQQLREETVFIITFGKDKYQLHLLSAKGDYIIVEAPKNALGSMIKIPKGTKLSVLFFNKSNKGFHFDTRVAGFASRDGQAVMHLAHSNQLHFLSQRRFRRRQTSIACNLFLVYVEGSGKKQRLVLDKRLMQGNITDISVGGCSIKIKTPVQVGARFKIEFTQGDENVAALGQVLRSNKAGAVTVFHVRFLKVSLRSMNIMNAFVYEYGFE